MIDTKHKQYNGLTFLIILVIILAYMWFITYGSFNFIKSEFFGKFYDSLGKNLLVGKCDVDPESIKFEAIVVNDKTYAYFGPFPAFFRIILNLLFPNIYGNWSRVSCLFASILSLIAFFLITQRQLVQNLCLPVQMKNSILNISLLAIGFGSPVLFLMSCGYIYHEAELWGFCWSLWAIYFLLGLLFDKNAALLKTFAFSFCAFFALLSKITYAVPLYLILLFIIISKLPAFIRTKTKSQDVFKYLVLALLPALLGVLVQLWYNMCRFGSITAFTLPQNYLYYLLNPSEMEICTSCGLSNFMRIPYTFLVYFIPYGIELFSKSFPYLFPNAFATCYVPGLFTSSEMPMPITIVSIFFIITAIFGGIDLLKTKGNYLIKLCVIAFMLQIFIILFHMCFFPRYLIEFFPFLIFLYSIFIRNFGKEIKTNNTKRNILMFGIFLCFFSAITTIVSTLRWVVKPDNWAISADYKNTLNDGFKKLDLILFK